MSDLTDIYIANPLTELGDTDLLYAVDTPGVSEADGAIAYSDFLAQILSDTEWAYYSAVVPTLSSSDDPVYILKFAGVNILGLFTNGMRVRFTQNSAAFNGIVVGFAYSSPDTYLTIYGGTDYDILNTTTYPITFFKYSGKKAPLDFPTDQAKWDWEILDTSSLAKGSAPVSGTVYNLSSLYIDIPIGAWALGSTQHTRAKLTTASPVSVGINGGLSTSASSESDKELLSTVTLVSPTITNGLFGFAMQSEKNILLTSKTRYYLTQRVNCAATLVDLYCRGDINTTKLYAKCAYL